MIEYEPERNKERIERIKQLSHAGVQPCKRKIIKQGAKPVDRACQNAADQTNWEDVQIFAVEKRNNQQQNARREASA
jgi:hypothetical protein